jgi:hypothetical protein
MPQQGIVPPPPAPGSILPGVGPSTIKGVALQSRPLSSAEAAIISQNLGAAVDPNDVRIAYDKSISGTDVKAYVMSRGLPTVVFSSPSAASEIPSSLMHEITHVWQNLHHDRYTNTIPIVDTYNPQPGKPFASYGPESQAVLTEAGDKSAQSFISAHRVRAANPADVAFLDSVRAAYGDKSGLGQDTDARLAATRKDSFRGVRNGELMADASPDKAQKKDWFERNSPEAVQAKGGDWFAQNAPPSASAPPPPPRPGFGAGVQSGLGLPGPISDLWGGVKQIATHPIDSAKLLLESAGEKQIEADKALKSGNISSPVIDALKDKNYPNAAGQVVGAVAGGAALGRFGRDTAYGRPPKSPSEMLSAGEAAQNITDAVNPAPKQMAAFHNNIEAQMQNIRLHAKSLGIEVRNAKDLLTVTRKAAESMRANYDKNILGPHADVTRSVDGFNYQGETVSRGGTAKQITPQRIGPTSESAEGFQSASAPLPPSAQRVSMPRFANLNQLETRLRAINGQLSGSYEKGGLAARAALSGDEKAALNAEAGAIRSILNEELGGRTGIGEEAVANARQDYGQMGNIADKLQLAISKQRFSDNRLGPPWKAAATGAAAGAISGHPGAAVAGAAGGLAAELIGRAVSKAAPNRSIRKAF